MYGHYRPKVTLQPTRGPTGPGMYPVLQLRSAASCALDALRIHRAPASSNRFGWARLDALAESGGRAAYSTRPYLLWMLKRSNLRGKTSSRFLMSSSSSSSRFKPLRR